MYVVANFVQGRDDGRKLSANYVYTLCRQRVGFELTKAETKKRPWCSECKERSW